MLYAVLALALIVIVTVDIPMALLNVLLGASVVVFVVLTPRYWRSETFWVTVLGTELVLLVALLFR